MVKATSNGTGILRNDTTTGRTVEVLTEENIALVENLVVGNRRLKM